MWVRKVEEKFWHSWDVGSDLEAEAVVEREADIFVEVLLMEAERKN